MAIAATAAQAKVLHVYFQGVAFGAYVRQGFTTELADCAAAPSWAPCEVARDRRTSADPAESSRARW